MIFGRLSIHVKLLVSNRVPHELSSAHSMQALVLVCRIHEMRHQPLLQHAAVVLASCVGRHGAEVVNLRVNAFKELRFRSEQALF